MKILQEIESSKTKILLFQWQDMTFFMAVTPLPDGEKCVSVRPHDVTGVRLSVDGRMASWTISREATEHSAAGAFTISDGVVKGATE